MPQKLDTVTTARDAQVDGRSIVYDLVLSNTIPSDQLAATRAAAQVWIRDRDCAVRDMRTLIEHGVKMRYRYTDAAGTRFETTVDRCAT